MIDSQVSFPKNDIDPKLKNKEWCLQAGKAIWYNWIKGMPPGSIFYAKRLRYREIDAYMMNNQDTTQYIKWGTGEENADTTFLNIDNSTDPIIKTHMQKIYGRLKNFQFNICATAIDPLAKGKLDEYFLMQKTKIMLRQAMMQQDPSLANHPLLAKEAGEADDTEELEMQMEFNPKFIRSKEAEQAINMLFYENEFQKKVEVIDENLCKYGVAVVKEEIDCNNRITIKDIWPGDFMCSHTRDRYFDDISYGAHIERVNLSDIAQYFEADELEQIAELCKGKDGNPAQIPDGNDYMRGYDSFKATVLSFEIVSYDVRATEERKNKKGNLKFGVVPPAMLNTNKVTYTGEGEARRYEGKTYEQVYKGKWVVGSGFIYDFGKAANQKRSMDKKKMGKTNLSYHVIAASFDKMIAKGIAEDLIPIADEIHMNALKLRQLRNKMIVNGIAIDFSALENVALGTGGKSMSPQENLDMLWGTGVLGWRSENIIADGKNQRRPVEPLIMDYANQFTSLWTDYGKGIEKLYNCSGLNLTTDSVSVDPKTLVGVANAQNQGTNNALHFIVSARRKLVEKVAKNCLSRLQTALLMGPYEGYVQTLGKNTIDFLIFEENNLPYDYDIIIEDRATTEEKQAFVQSMQMDIEKGLLDSSDVITASTMYNLKDAEIVMRYRAKKAREKMQNDAMQQQQQNGQIQMQSAQAAEASKQETLKLEYQLKDQLENIKGGYMVQVAEIQAKAKVDHGELTTSGSIIKTGMSEHNKSQIAANAQAQEEQGESAMA